LAWRADPRGFVLARAGLQEAARRRAEQARWALDTARVGVMAEVIAKPTFTRADLVEVLAPQIPYDQPDPRTVVEGAADTVPLRVTAPREAHHREGHERFTLDAIMVEEERIFDMVDDRDDAARLPVSAADVAGLSPDQERVIRAIAGSPFLVQPLQAPAGAGKTFSLAALHAAALRAGREVLVVAPTGRAVDQAMGEGAGDYGLTVAKALSMIDRGALTIGRHSLVVLDEASMLGTPQLRTLLGCTSAARAKIVTVGDSYQLAPVLARGGMFDDLMAELPWAQHLSVVWRMQDPDERDMSLALRSAHGNRLRKAVGWYRIHGRLHTGDEVTMAADARDAFVAACREGRDVLLMCDSWEMADAINTQLHTTLTPAGDAVPCSRGQAVSVGDVIVSRRNADSIEVLPPAGAVRPLRLDPVRNGNRWRVAAVNIAEGRVAAVRCADGARAVFEGEYLAGQVSLGFAVTLQSAQGATVDSAFTVMRETASRSAAYVAMTRGRVTNQLFIYPRTTGEADHEHTTPPTGEGVAAAVRGSKYEAAARLRAILEHDDRPRTMHTEADRAEREVLPVEVVEVLGRHDMRRAARRRRWRDMRLPARVRERSVQVVQREPQQVALRDPAELRAEFEAARDQVAALRGLVAADAGPAMVAARPVLAGLRARADADRPYAAAVAAVEAAWRDADTAYEVTLGFVEQAQREWDALRVDPAADPLEVASARFGLRLAMMQLPLVVPAGRFQPDLEAARAAREAAAGGPARIVTAADVEWARLAAIAEDQELLAAAVARRNRAQREWERAERVWARAERDRDAADAERDRDEGRDYSTG